MFHKFPTSTFSTRRSSFDISLDLVFRISYFVFLLGILKLIPDFRPPAFPIAGAHGIQKEIRLSAF